MFLLFMQLLRSYTDSAIPAENTAERRRGSNLFSAIKLNAREVTMNIVSRVSKAVTSDRVPLESS
jgi:hypothetical protein